MRNTSGALLCWTASTTGFLLISAFPLVPHLMAIYDLDAVPNFIISALHKVVSALPRAVYVVVAALTLPTSMSILQKQCGLLPVRSNLSPREELGVGGSQALVFELKPQKIPGFAGVWSAFEAACTLPNNETRKRYTNRVGGEFEYFHKACGGDVGLSTVAAGWARERKEWSSWLWDLMVVSPTPIGTPWWPYGGKYERSSEVNGMPAPFKVHRTEEEEVLLTRLSHWMDDMQNQGVQTKPWRPRGFFYYPPQGWREWHSNWNTPGWRMYLVSNTVDRGSSFFYRDFRTGSVVHREEPRAIVRLFQIPRGGGWFRGGPLLWHSIRSYQGRFSFGLNLNTQTAREIVTGAGGTFYDPA